MPLGASRAGRRLNKKDDKMGFYLTYVLLYSNNNLYNLISKTLMEGSMRDNSKTENLMDLAWPVISNISMMGNGKKESKMELEKVNGMMIQNKKFSQPI